MDLNFFKGKRVLITGATGLIGSHITNKLLSLDNIKVIVLGRSKTKLENIFCDYVQTENIDCLEHDISQPLPSTLGKVDYIFHAASPISSETIKTKPLDVINSNLAGAVNCLEYLKKQGFGKMVIFSSATVYSVDEPSHVAIESVTCQADCIGAPNAPYSESKRMVEVISNAYHKQYNVDTLVARFSYVYGYSQNVAQTAFYEFVGRALNGDNIVMNKSGLSRRETIYVDDAVEGLLHLCHVGINGEAYNISSNGDKGNYIAVDEMAEIIANIANRLIDGNNVKVEFKETGGTRKEGLRLSNERIKSTGWNVLTSMEEGILKTMKQFLDRRQRI